MNPSSWRGRSRPHVRLLAKFPSSITRWLAVPHVAIGIASFLGWSATLPGQGVIDRGPGIWQEIPAFTSSWSNEALRATTPLGVWEPLESKEHMDPPIGYIDKAWGPEGLLVRVIVSAKNVTLLEHGSLEGDLFVDWAPPPHHLPFRKIATYQRVRFKIGVEAEPKTGALPVGAKAVQLDRSGPAWIYSMILSPPPSAASPVDRVVGLAVRVRGIWNSGTSLGRTATWGLTDTDELKRSLETAPYLVNLHRVVPSKPLQPEFFVAAYHAINGAILVHVAELVGTGGAAAEVTVTADEQPHPAHWNTAGELLRTTSILVPANSDRRLRVSTSGSVQEFPLLLPQIDFLADITTAARQAWAEARLEAHDHRLDLLLAALRDYADALAFPPGGTIGHQQWSLRVVRGTVNRQRAADFIDAYIRMCRPESPLAIEAYADPQGALYPVISTRALHPAALRVVFHPQYVHYTRFEFIERSLLQWTERGHQVADPTRDGYVYLYGAGNNAAGAATLEMKAVRRILESLKPGTDIPVVFEGQSQGATMAFRQAAVYRQLVDGIDARSGAPLSVWNDFPHLLAADGPYTGMTIGLAVGEKDKPYVAFNRRAQQRFQEMNIPTTLDIIPGEGHSFTRAPMPVSPHAPASRLVFGRVSECDPEIITIGRTSGTQLLDDTAYYLARIEPTRITIQTSGIEILQTGPTLSRELAKETIRLFVDGQAVNVNPDGVYRRLGRTWRLAAAPTFIPAATLGELVRKPMIVLDDPVADEDTVMAAELLAEQLRESGVSGYYDATVAIHRFAEISRMPLTERDAPILICTSPAQFRQLFPAAKASLGSVTVADDDRMDVRSCGDFLVLTPAAKDSADRSQTP